MKRAPWREAGGGGRDEGKSLEQERGDTAAAPTSRCVLLQLRRAHSKRCRCRGNAAKLAEPSDTHQLQPCRLQQAESTRAGRLERPQKMPLLREILQESQPYVAIYNSAIIARGRGGLHWLQALLLSKGTQQEKQEETGISYNIGSSACKKAGGILSAVNHPAHCRKR